MSYPTEAKHGKQGYKRKRSTSTARFYDRPSFKRQVGQAAVLGSGALGAAAGTAIIADEAGFLVPGRPSTIPRTPLTVGELLHELQQRGTGRGIKPSDLATKAMRDGALWAVKQAFKRAAPQINFVTALVEIWGQVHGERMRQLRGQKPGNWTIDYFCGSTNGPNFGPLGRNDGAVPCPTLLTITYAIWNSQINAYAVTGGAPNRTFRATYVDKKFDTGAGAYQGRLCVRYRWNESASVPGIPRRPTPSTQYGLPVVPIVYEPAVLPLLDPMTLPIPVGGVPVEIPVLPRAVPTTRPLNPFRVPGAQTERGPVPQRPPVPPRVADVTPSPPAKAGAALQRPPSRAGVTTKWPERPRAGTKEVKLKGVPTGIARAIINGATEFHDVVAAIYNALPKGHKPPAYSGIGRARAVWENLEHVNWDQAMRNLVANQIEDFLYGSQGRFGKRALNSARKHGYLPPGARGFQSGQWDTFPSQDLEKGDPIGDAVDTVWEAL